MKIGKEIKKYKPHFHSRKSCFPLSKPVFYYVVCPTAGAIPQQKRKKKCYQQPLASRDIQFYQSLYWPFSNLINFHFRIFD